MDLKIIPAPLYKDSNGIPAYKSGEWPGIKPNHFHRTRRMLNQTRKNILYDRKISLKHFQEKKSEEYKFKPSVILVKSYLENEKNNKTVILPGRKHFNEYYKSISDTYDNNLFFGHKRRINNIKYDNILLPRLFSEEKNKMNIRQKFISHSLRQFSIEDSMVRKKRINSLEQQRNNFRCGIPGDKNYRYAECSENFFKEGGLIPGSTNDIKISENLGNIKNNIYAKMNLKIKSLDVNKIWNYKINKEKKEGEKSYVLNLESWDKRHIKFDDKENLNLNNKSAMIKNKFRK